MDIKYSARSDSFLDITISQNWEHISETRSYISGILKNNLENDIKISKVVISISELLENAVKFGNQDTIRAIIKKYEEKKELELIVYNYLSKEKALRLIQYIKSINNINDPIIFYKNRMKEVVSEGKKGGLGLVRIKCECEAEISAHYSEEQTDKGLVCVAAKFIL